ncbi:MAG TPA: hypothetical protein VKX17_27315 [Planctomycetota bacterium]|nr:hypothetical protein [Planctomycetota bacterium]
MIERFSRRVAGMRLPVGIPQFAEGRYDIPAPGHDGMRNPNPAIIIRSAIETALQAE